MKKMLSLVILFSVQTQAQEKKAMPHDPLALYDEFIYADPLISPQKDGEIFYKSGVDFKSDIDGDLVFDEKPSKYSDGRLGHETTKIRMHSLDANGKKRSGNHRLVKDVVYYKGSTSPDGKSFHGIQRSKMLRFSKDGKVGFLGACYQNTKKPRLRCAVVDKEVCDNREAIEKMAKKIKACHNVTTSLHILLQEKVSSFQNKYDVHAPYPENLQSNETPSPFGIESPKSLSISDLANRTIDLLYHCDQVQFSEQNGLPSFDQVRQETIKNVDSIIK
jgi:hypothetical protein